jgi:hypothetical protein
MRPRARILGGLLIAAALMCWVAVGFDLANFRLLGEEAAARRVLTQKAAHRAAGDVLFAIRLVLMGVAGAAFVEWLYQSRVNLRAFGVRRLRYPRGWALGAFLVPALNLVRPYQVVREVWQASDPGIRDPFAWNQVRPGWLLPAWWGASVAWALLALVSLGMTLGAGTDAAKLQLARGVLLAADAAAALAVSLAYFVVDHISRAQEQKWGLRRQAPPG